MLRHHLAHQKCLVTPVTERLGYKFFGRALAVHLGGIDHGHAQVDGHLQCGDFIASLLRPFCHPPRALTEDRNRFPAGKRRRSKTRRSG
jgi:hypothetical protein